MMFEFFRKFFKKDYDELIEDQDLISSIVFYDMETDTEMTIHLVCSCGLHVNIVAIDENDEPAIFHFECMHCDRSCDVKNCRDCAVYSKMADARDIAEN
jgi:hypothetical protein